ncbi:MAG: diaminopimelate epimerase [Calditrichia bacterium]
MKNEIPFIKMQGAGNDFVVIDNRPSYLDGTEIEIVRKLCDRHFGIGADGLMLLDFRQPDHFSLKYYNSDGKPAEMCGNGARCAVYMMHLLNPAHKEFDFGVFGEPYSGSVTGTNRVKIYWNRSPLIINIAGLEKEVPTEFKRFLYVNSGVPHLVLEVQGELGNFDITGWGAFFRNHPLFSPQGTNVNFVRLHDHEVTIRTFERGVEGETLACGTGALAAATAVHHWGQSPFPIDIQARGGLLTVDGSSDLSNMSLEGPVRRVFTGSVKRTDL